MVDHGVAVSYTTLSVVKPPWMGSSLTQKGFKQSGSFSYSIRQVLPSRSGPFWSRLPGYFLVFYLQQIFPSCILGNSRTRGTVSTWRGSTDTFYQLSFEFPNSKLSFGLFCPGFLLVSFWAFEGSETRPSVASCCFISLVEELGGTCKWLRWFA